MRLVPLSFLLLLLGCQSSPYGPFDSGHDVHVIVRADPVPDKGLHVRPVCTLEDQVIRSSARVIGKKNAAYEVAAFRSAGGKRRFAIWEPRTWTDARAELEVDHELWIVLTIEPKARQGKLQVYNRPPDDEIGAWHPLVAVPD